MLVRLILNDMTRHSNDRNGQNNKWRRS